MSLNPRISDIPPSFKSTRIIDWAVYAGIAVSTAISALVGRYNVDSDTVAYLDLSNAVRAHQWHALVNASWFPLYPALLTIGRSFFHFRPQYDLMAARLVDCAIELLLIFACVVLATMLHRLMLVRGVAANRLLPRRTLSLWVAIFSYFFIGLDLVGIKPDALVSVLLLFAVAALIWGLIRGGFLPFIALGLCGGLAYWGKAFAFPIFVLLLLFTAAANLRRPRVLAGLLTSAAVFALVAGPYIWQISADKGRLTIGDSGRLNTAWYVNGADRFNPISDLIIYHRHDAVGDFKHPGELLSPDPEVTYYGGDKVYGSTPQWDDFSYWSDGLHSRFVLGETLTTILRNTESLLLFTLPMRLQALLLLAVPICWGFTVRRQSLADPILLVLPLVALASIASLTLVHLETRYIAFSFMILGAVFAACSLSNHPSDEARRSLHLALVLASGLILVANLQTSMRELKAAQKEGAHPLQGIYSAPVLSAGVHLASLYPRGTEVACLGDFACWEDPLWTEYARVKMTAIVETGPGAETKSADQGCRKLDQAPQVLDSLRQHNVRVIVGRFDKPFPCSSQWMPLEDSGQFFYLPL
ncbi:MAG: hypothetical protein M3O31_13720 [Acidobacteriota bacterium]|nr:hypothetical protein [Acidobacteriota bacterium]